MPYKSLAQARYFHANKQKLEKQGVSVSEYDKATDFSKLPKKKAPSLRDGLGKKRA